MRAVSSWIKGASDDADEDDFVIAMNAQRSGTGEHSVNEILGFQAFAYPKPPSLILNLLRQASNPGDIVLDFFAGSGTTAHAVLALNAENPDEAPAFPGAGRRAGRRPPRPCPGRQAGHRREQ